MTYLPQSSGPWVYAPAYAPLSIRPLSPLPRAPTDYHQLLRGPRFHSWRPLLSLLLVVGIGGALMIAVSLGGEGLVAADIPGLGSLDDELSPVTVLTLDLTLAALIPASGLSVPA